jgi:DNA repair exonuclease SbcCD ATPase subunit
MDNTVVAESVNPYSSITSWEVWNFQSIEHGKCEFDERNIINLKGYNDSGKSAMLNALKVALCNANPTKQVGFIQDDKDYFRVLVTFSDGVQILRDKYINGQSLYEMYKDGKCVFSTKNGNALTKVSDVPQPIADYLGLIMYDGACLNARACFEKQIGVQTSGSENYKMFNTVLKSEEIATASTLLNNDKNKLASDISATDYDLQAQKNLLGTSGKITEDMVVFLKEHDAELDKLEANASELIAICNIYNGMISIPVIPEIASIDMSQVSELANIERLIKELNGVVITPEVTAIDTVRLTELANIVSLNNALAQISVAPELATISDTQLNDLLIISNMVSTLAELDKEISDADKRISDTAVELEQLQKELANHGVKMVKCPGCGQIFDPEQQHVH